jgi:RimJ/RimL family protein N-acetyltransferase
VFHAPLEVPRLSDGVVLLRPFEPDDGERLVLIWQDAEIRRRNHIPAEPTPEVARQWVAEKARLAADGIAWEWAVVDAATGELAGRRAVSSLNWSDRRAETSTWIAPEFRGRRLAPRSLRLAAAHAFANGIARIQGDCEVDNRASFRSLQAAGLHHDGTLRSYFVTIQGHRCDVETFSLLPEDLGIAAPL